jgi:hypothetical protein
MTIPEGLPVVMRDRAVASGRGQTEEAADGAAKDPLRHYDAPFRGSC